MLSILLAGFSIDQPLYETCDNLKLKSEKYYSVYSDFTDKCEAITSKEFMLWVDIFWEVAKTCSNESNAYIEKLNQISENTDSDLVKVSAKVLMADWYYKNNYRSKSENVIYKIIEQAIDHVPYFE